VKDPSVELVVCRARRPNAPALSSIFADTNFAFENDRRSHLIYVFEDPVEFVRRRAKALNEGQYRVMLLFLGTQFDEEFLKDVDGLTRDLDRLTGPHAMAVLFTPPPELQHFQSGFGGFQALGRFWTDWDAFVDTMTDGTYTVAQDLGIPYKDLPCIAFLNIYDDELKFGLWKLKGTPFREVYDDLRSVFDSWYRDNTRLIEKIAKLQILERHPWGKVPTNHPEMPLFQQFLRIVVLPKLVNAADNSGVSAQTRKRIEGLSSQPRNTEVVSLALKQSPTMLSVGGHFWTAQSFTEDFYQFVRNEARDQRQKLLSKLVFPLDQLSSTSRKLSMYRLISRVDIGSVEAEAGGLKLKYNPLSMLRRAFGMRDPA
jgi:hypothetical protein